MRLFAFALLTGLFFCAFLSVAPVSAKTAFQLKKEECERLRIDLNNAQTEREKAQKALMDALGSLLKSQKSEAEKNKQLDRMRQQVKTANDKYVQLEVKYNAKLKELEAKDRQIEVLQQKNNVLAAFVRYFQGQSQYISRFPSQIREDHRNVFDHEFFRAQATQRPMGYPDSWSPDVADHHEGMAAHALVFYGQLLWNPFPGQKAVKQYFGGRLPRINAAIPEWFDPYKYMDTHPDIKNHCSGTYNHPLSSDQAYQPHRGKFWNIDNGAGKIFPSKIISLNEAGKVICAVSHFMGHISDEKRVENQAPWGEDL